MIDEQFVWYNRASRSLNICNNIATDSESFSEFGLRKTELLADTLDAIVDRNRNHLLTCYIIPHAKRVVNMKNEIKIKQNFLKRVDNMKKVCYNGVTNTKRVFKAW